MTAETSTNKQAEPTTEHYLPARQILLGLPGNTTLEQLHRWDRENIGVPGEWFQFMESLEKGQKHGVKSSLGHAMRKKASRSTTLYEVYSDPQINNAIMQITSPFLRTVFAPITDEDYIGYE